jgi:regulator of replication initiation timing
MEIIMQYKTAIEILNEKVSDILQKYGSLKTENEMLRTELITLKSQQQINLQELDNLRDLNTSKDLEIEEIVSKIESLVS